MKIAYFTESLPPLTDGVSRTLSNLRKTLTSENHEYIFYSPFRSNQDGWNGNVFKVISAPFPLYAQYRVSLPFFHDIRNSLRRFKPDIIHICSPFFLGMTAYSYAREAGIPAVNSFHTRFVSYLEYYGFGWFEKYGWRYLKWFYNRGDMVFVPSLATIEELRGRGFNNLRQWARGINIEKFSPRFADRNLKNRWSPDSRPVALFVGRLVLEKDIEVLLRAHEILKNRGIDYRLVMVGDGPMRQRIEKSHSDIILEGHLEGEALSRAYASADLFVFPSTTESYGNVVQEAGASGLPAIGASEGGIKDLIIDGKTGFLAGPRDADDFARKMEILLTDEALRNSLAANALEFASAKSWDKINRGLFDDYKNLISSKPGNGSINERNTFGSALLKQSDVME